MARCVWPWRALALAVFALSGCGLFERAERPAWRTRAENACFAEERVKPSDLQQLRPPIDGPGICGLTRPLRVTALQNGRVSVNKPLTLDCSMTAALDSWMDEALQADALMRFGVPIVRIDAFGAYSCRSIDNLGGMPLSEHAFGNAVDIGGFTLADGRTIVVARDWDRPNTQESAFLRDADASACQRFTTVLAPGADEHHSDHLHLDLAMHGRTRGGPRRICRPDPSPAPPPPPDGLPPAPNVEEPLDVSRAPRLKPAESPLALQGGLRAPLAEAYEPSLAPPPVLPMGPESRLDSADSLDVPGD